MFERLTDRARRAVVIAQEKRGASATTTSARSTSRSASSATSDGVAAQVLATFGVELPRVRQAVLQLVSDFSGPSSYLEAARFETAAERPSPDELESARCGFCFTPSPACGALFAGPSGVLICQHCVAETRLSRIDVRRARDDGAALPNVEGGENLGRSQDEVMAKFGGIAARTSTTVEQVRFVNEHEAALLWKVTLEGRPILGTLLARVVLVDGQWKVARESVCQMFARAGVNCPPRPGLG